MKRSASGYPLIPAEKPPKKPVAPKKCGKSCCGPTTCRRCRRKKKEKKLELWKEFDVEINQGLDWSTTASLNKIFQNTLNFLNFSKISQDFSILSRFHWVPNHLEKLPDVWRSRMEKTMTAWSIEEELTEFPDMHDKMTKDVEKKVEIVLGSCVLSHCIVQSSIPIRIWIMEDIICNESD